MAKKDNIVNLREDGILYMVNRQVFHPRGFALGVDPETGELHLYGSGDEVWSYDESMKATEDELFVAFEAMLNRNREGA